jgi:hypothetical protein
MESKIYHIYSKDNQCLESVLTEEEFKEKWGNLNHNQYEYEELTIDKRAVAESSY